MYENHSVTRLRSGDKQKAKQMPMSRVYCAKRYSGHLKAFDKAAKLQVMKAYERMRSLRSQGLSEEEAWNANAVELNRAARVHTRQYIARTFDEHVKSIVDGPCREVLRDLLHLHLNYELLDMAYYLLE
ncbi:hypothetical protein OSTOST_16652, partial [Ostertagia ostertagi]